MATERRRSACAHCGPYEPGVEHPCFHASCRSAPGRIGRTDRCDKSSGPAPLSDEDDQRVVVDAALLQPVDQAAGVVGFSTIAAYRSSSRLDRRFRSSGPQRDRVVTRWQPRAAADALRLQPLEVTLLSPSLPLVVPAAIPVSHSSGTWAASAAYTQRTGGQPSSSCDSMVPISRS
jgi:hypothetical protein